MILDYLKRSQSFFVGIDVGSSYTKLVLLNDRKEIVTWSIKRSGTNFATTANNCLDEVLSFVGLKIIDVDRFVATGYGRKNVPYAKLSRTEIGCHAKGCFYYFPSKISIVDIGGQDNKIIKLDDRGKRVSFRMNRKCAAGTGAFLEEMSLRLNIPLENMNKIALSATGMVRLGSFCTVFSATEVLENIRMGKNVGDIVKGLFFSVLKRVTEMDSLSGNVVMTGGVVAHNSYLTDLAKILITSPILVPKYPQLTGALGAALYAMEI